MDPDRKLCTVELPTEKGSMLVTTFKDSIDTRSGRTSICFGGGYEPQRGDDQALIIEIAEDAVKYLPENDPLQQKTSGMIPLDSEGKKIEKESVALKELLQYEGFLKDLRNVALSQGLRGSAQILTGDHVPKGFPRKTPIGYNISKEGGITPAVAAAFAGKAHLN